MSRPLLLGHRGARANKHIPENTLTSFERALVDGCDGFEFDVRLTADRQAVICHDPKVGNSQVACSSYEQLPSLPRLEDVLTRFGQAFLDIELKVAGLEEIVVAELKKSNPENFVISSFLPDVLATLHALDRALPLGLICETKIQLQSCPKLPVQYVISYYALANRTLIRELHTADKKVFVWAVNRPRVMQKFAGWEVDGIISDDTKLLSQTLSPKS
jgi:glycerophosphoryl diester phosphodiesterase